MIFLTTSTWACGKHEVDDPWTRPAFETVKRNLHRLVWWKPGDNHASIGHIINCWKGTMVFLAGRLQNSDTLAQAWTNNMWGTQWTIVHPNEFPIEGSGAKGKGDKKGKTRPRDDDGGNGSDRSWQSRADSVNAKYAKLMKTVEKGKRYKGSWGDGYSKEDWFEQSHGSGDKGEGKKSGKKT